MLLILRYSLYYFLSYSHYIYGLIFHSTATSGCHKKENTLTSRTTPGGGQPGVADGVNGLHTSRRPPPRLVHLHTGPATIMPRGQGLATGMEGWTTRTWRSMLVNCVIWKRRTVSKNHQSLRSKKVAPRDHTAQSSWTMKFPSPSLPNQGSIGLR